MGLGSSVYTLSSFDLMPYYLLINKYQVPWQWFYNIMRCKNILGLRAWIHLPHLCFLHYLLLSPVSFLSLPDFFVFVFNTKKNLHGTEFPRSNPHLNSIIPIKKLRNGPHSALPADIFFSPSHCFLHCLVTEGIFGNGVNACLS